MERSSPWGSAEPFVLLQPCSQRARALLRAGREGDNAALQGPAGTSHLGTSLRFPSPQTLKPLRFPHKPVQKELSDYRLDQISGSK